MLKGWVRRPLRWCLDRAGRAYVPAELEEALVLARRYGDSGAACTLGYFQSPGETPDQVAARSQAILEALPALSPGAYLSLKAPALAYDAELIGVLAGAVQTQGGLLHFDSHEPHTQDATLACAEAVRGLGVRVGVTLPGRWSRSLTDVGQACRLGLRVRVVKGEWADAAEPGRDRRAGFQAVVEALAQQGAARVAVATHDPILARESLERLLAAGTSCELELLHGLPARALTPLARELGVPLRYYIPHGKAWRPYALSKAAENPRLAWWLVQDFLRGLGR